MKCNMTVLYPWLTQKMSHFHVSTPGYSSSPPYITTSNRGTQANSPLSLREDWLSHSAHLPSCFCYDSHTSLPPVTRLSSPDSQNSGCHDAWVLTVKGWIDAYFPLRRTGFKCVAKGYNEVIDVLVGVMTHEVWLNYFEKVYVGVGAHNISNLWSFHRENGRRQTYQHTTQACTKALKGGLNTFILQLELILNIRTWLTLSWKKDGQKMKRKMVEMN